MIAIPVDEKESTTISELYGNAPYFVILDTNSGVSRVLKNKECGNGPKSSEFLNSLGVTATVFFHMGEGVYKAFEKKLIDVFSVKKNHYTVDEIHKYILDNSLVKVNSSNYKELLDPGQSSCTCASENS